MPIYSNADFIIYIIKNCVIAGINASQTFVAVENMALNVRSAKAVSLILWLRIGYRRNK
jgi:hypothetical protein